MNEVMAEIVHQADSPPSRNRTVRLPFSMLFPQIHFSSQYRRMGTYSSQSIGKPAVMTRADFESPLHAIRG
jgi:hypothetical protein